MNLIFKRRRLIVDRFQYRLLAISLIHFGFVLLFFSAALFLPLALQLDNPSLSWVEKEQVANMMLFYDEKLWLPLVGIFLLLTIHSVFVTHRIAGPLYRFRMTFKALAEGNLSTRANLRKHDYLKNDACVINDMIGTLETRIRSLENQAMRLQEGVAQLEETLKTGAVEEAKNVLERVQSQVEGLQGDLAHFRNKPQSPGRG